MPVDGRYRVSSPAAARPGVGKHAVRHADFFARVAARQRDAMPAGWRYRPLKVELELTDGCNLTCAHCGMGARAAAEGRSLPGELLDALPGQLAELGIPGLSITGGEPLLARARLLRLLERCRGAVDVVKLTTNGYWARTPAAARETLVALREAGLAAARWFRPVLQLSIGEQELPVDCVTWARQAARELFTPDEPAVCVSTLRLHGQPDRRAELERRHLDLTGRSFPWDEVHVTARTYARAGHAADDPELPRRATPIRELCRSWGCFRPTVGHHVVPTPLIKADGTVHACAVFNVPAQLRLGDLRRQPLRDVLAAANRSPAVRAIAAGGLPGLLASLPDDALVDATAGDFHEACGLLLAELEARGLLAEAAP